MLTCEDLAQLNAPLVERVDVPDDTLGEGDVLIVRNQCAQSPRGDLVGQNRGGRAVAQEDLVGLELIGGTLSYHLIASLADHEGLRLGKEVRSQHPAKGKSCLAPNPQKKAPGTHFWCFLFSTGL